MTTPRTNTAAWNLLPYFWLIATWVFICPVLGEESSQPTIDANAAVDSVKQLDAQVQEIQRQERLLQDELLRKRREATEGERKWQSLLGEIEQNSLQQRDLDQSLKQAQKARDEATTKQKEALTAVDEARKAVEAAQKRLKEAEATAQKATTALQAAEKPISEWESKLKSLVGQVEPLKMAAAKAETDAAPAIHELESMRDRVAEMAVQRMTHQRQIEDLLKTRGDWVSFSDQIAPIFQQRCVACHNARNSQGQYNMVSYNALHSGGESGLAIIAGNANESLLVKLIEDGSMPSDSDPLSSEQIAIIRRWIDLGARLDSKANADTRLVRLMPRLAQPTPPETYTATLPVTALAVDHTGSRLVSSGYHELLVWSLPDGKLVRRIPDVAERVYGLDFHPDGKRIAVASGTPGQVGEVKVFDVETGERLNDLLVSEDVMFDVSFSPDGRRLAACGADGTIVIFSLDERQGSTRFIEDHSDWVNSIAWSPDGNQLVSASRDKTAKLFDVAIGKLLLTFTGHQQNVTAAIFSEDGKRVISGGDDRRLRIWNVNDAKEVRSISIGASELNDLHRSSKNRVFVAGSDNNLRSYELAEGKELVKLKLSSDWVVSIATTRDELTAYCGTQDGQIHRIQLGDKPKIDRSWQAKP